MASEGVYGSRIKHESILVVTTIGKGTTQYIHNSSDNSIPLIFFQILSCTVPLPGATIFRREKVRITKRYHALRRLPQKVHLRISPNGIADICTREDSETIGITMDIFLFLSSLEARHVIFLCEGHHFVFWGWSSCRQSRI